MEKVTKNILIEKDFINQNSTAIRSSRYKSPLLQDLNYDCLREIIQHLDLAAQFSLLKSSKQFLQIILYDIWYPFYDDIFDIAKDQSMLKQTKDFQLDLLKLLIKNFSRIKGISLEIFQKFLIKIPNEDFSNISKLSITNFNIDQTGSHILDFKNFDKFPHLQDLELIDLSLEFSSRDTFLALRSLNLRNIIVLNDGEGDFLKQILNYNLEKLTLILPPANFITYNNFSEIEKCLQLKELTISSHYLYDPRILDCILNLTSLHILTLESKDNFYFTSKDHTIFYVILKTFSQNPYKYIKTLHLNGMTEKIFFFCPYLQDITHLNWIITKIFHRKSDGSVEWKSDIPKVIKSFYDFLVDTKGLRQVFVRDNIFHKKRVIKELDFVEKIQDLRMAKGFERLKFVNNYKEFSLSKSLKDLTEGSVRFFMAKRD